MGKLVKLARKNAACVDIDCRFSIVADEIKPLPDIITPFIQEAIDAGAFVFIEEEETPPVKAINTGKKKKGKE